MDGPAPLTYNPGFLSEDDFRKSFVVRGNWLKLVLEVVQRNTGESNQHVLLVGPRGAGKTTLARMVALEAHIDPVLREKWYPLVMAEETYEATTPGEFWLEALRHVHQQEKDPRLAAVCEELAKETDESRLHDRALARLMDFADEQKKRILLVVENLNMLLEDQLDTKAAWVLRHTLMNEPRLMLLGTSPTEMAEQTSRSDRAWYEMLLTYKLPPLDDDECRVLWKHLTEKELAGQRIRPIRILTGGSPRLVALFSTFAVQRSLRDLMKDLVQLIDAHTEYFKSRLDNLAVKERKVFVALLERWDPSTAREVATTARLGASEASAFLKRLEWRGFVERQEQGKVLRYQVAERLFNIYYLMRRRGDPGSRVYAAVRFLTSYYEGPELVDQTAALALEACGLPSEQRPDYVQTLAGILEAISDPDLRYTLGTKVSAQFLRLPEAIEVLGRNPHSADFWHGHGMHHVRSDPKDAEAAFRQEIQLAPGSASVWFWLGVSLYDQPERLGEAEAVFRRAAYLAPHNCLYWCCLGFILWGLSGRDSEAEQVFQRSIELEPVFWRSWTGLALVSTRNPNRLPELVRFAEEILAKEERKPEVLVNAASALLQTQWREGLGHVEKWSRESVGKDPKNAIAWSQLAESLARQEERSELLSVLRSMLRSTEPEAPSASSMVPVFAISAAHGYGREALQALTESPARKDLEPLVVGLRLFLGEPVVVAEEILQVGKDIAEQIRRKQGSLKAKAGEAKKVLQAGSA